MARQPSADVLVIASALLRKWENMPGYRTVRVVFDLELLDEDERTPRRSSTRSSTPSRWLTLLGLTSSGSSRSSGRPLRSSTMTGAD